MELPPLGSTVDELDTPCLLIDVEPFDRNIQRMSEHCRTGGVAWRPHAKSHKNPTIAQRLLDAGAIGITCAKLGEAEVMAAGGINDLLIANELIGRRKLERLVALRRQADPIATVDHPVQVDALSEAASASGVSLRTIVEVDVGLNRCGQQPGAPAADLARRIDAASGLELVGIMGYEGHCLRIPDPDEKEREIRAAVQRLADTKNEFDRAGLPCPIISAAGTGTYQITARMDTVTEMQAGGGIFMDLTYRNQMNVAELEYALTILTTVTSRPKPGVVIVDAGRKTMNMELHMPEVRGRSDMKFISLSAEHGQIELSGDAGPAVGDRLEVIPGYGDFTTVLHDYFFAMRGGKLEAIWPLEARGRLD